MRIGRTTAEALLVVLAGCARCGRDPAPPPERFLRSDAPAAVVIPSLRAAQDQARALLETVRQFPAAAGVDPLVTATREQLGFDPLDPRAAEEVGLDVARGAAVALTDGATPPLLVLPVRDGGKLEATVARLARDRAGAGRRDVQQVGGASVTVLRRGEGAPATLALVLLRDTALLSAGPDAPARVAAAATLDPAASLAASGPFALARKTAREGTAALAFAPAASPATREAALLRDGAALSVSASGTRVALRAALLLPKARQEWWRGVVSPGGAGTPTAELAARLPRDAFLVGRFDGDPAAVAGRALSLLPEPGAALQQAGLDPERDLLSRLAPGVAAAVSLAPTFEVAAVSRGGELRASDPFRLVHLAAIAHVKDAAAAAETLARLARAAPRLGLTAAPARVAGREAWRLGWGSSSLDLSLDGNRLLVGGGPGVLEALVAAKGGYAAPTEEARAALAGGSAAAVLDFTTFVGSFRALPPRAYGTGPDAFVMRSLADRVVDPASRLSAASLRVELTPEAALLDLVVEARAAGKGSP